MYKPSLNYRSHEQRLLYKTTPTAQFCLNIASYLCRVLSTPLSTVDANRDNPQELLPSLPRKLTSTSQRTSSVYQSCLQSSRLLLCCEAGKEFSQQPCGQAVRQSGISALQRLAPAFLDHPGNWSVSVLGTHTGSIQLHQNCSRTNLSLILIPHL